MKRYWLCETKISPGTSDKEGESECMYVTIPVVSDQISKIRNKSAYKQPSNPPNHSSQAGEPSFWLLPEYKEVPRECGRTYQENKQTYKN